MGAGLYISMERSDFLIFPNFLIAEVESCSASFQAMRAYHYHYCILLVVKEMFSKVSKSIRIL